MGDTFSSDKDRDFLDKIEFFETAEDRNFDKLDIYRLRDPPYEYILDHKKNYIGDNERTNQYISLMNQLKNLEHKNIAKIHSCILKEGNPAHIQINSYASSIEWCTPIATTTTLPSPRPSRKRK